MDEHGGVVNEPVDHGGNGRVVRRLAALAASRRARFLLGY